jgi:aspartate carbamoyltransferase regulatory subunit
MLNISGIKEGYVLDHIKAGTALKIYNDLKLNELEDCTIAMIMNVQSKKMGKKDILKVECPIGTINLDILGFIDKNITVNIVKDEKIIEKKPLSLPKTITNVIKCKNPRCITTIEQGLDQVFFLSDEENHVYRCKYCEEKYSEK